MTAYTEIFFIVYLKIKHNWAPIICFAILAVGIKKGKRDVEQISKSCSITDN